MKNDGKLTGQQKIAQQSRQWLICALMNLMKVKRFDEISVGEIAEKAQVSRRTFYRNFKSKADLLDRYVTELIDEYVSQLRSEQPLAFDELLLVFFKFWHEHLDIIKTLFLNNLFYKIIGQYNQHLAELYVNFRASWHIVGTDSEIRYVTMFGIGGLWNVLFLWAMKEDRETPEKMAALIQKVIKKL